MESQIEAVVDRKLQRISIGQRRKVISAGETVFPWVNMWLPKLGTTERKIILKLAEKYPLQLTKADIAQLTQYAPDGGTF